MTEVTSVQCTCSSDGNDQNELVYSIRCSVNTFLLLLFVVFGWKPPVFEWDPPSFEGDCLAVSGRDSPVSKPASPLTVNGIALPQDGIAPSQDGTALSQDGIAPSQDGIAPSLDGTNNNNHKEDLYNAPSTLSKLRDALQTTCVYKSKINNVPPPTHTHTHRALVLFCVGSKAVLYPLNSTDSKARFDIISEINHLVHCLLKKGAGVTFCWIPSHCELTFHDRAVKRGAINTRQSAILDVPLSSKEMCNIIEND